jgi:hypothetical protein
MVKRVPICPPSSKDLISATITWSCAQGSSLGYAPGTWATSQSSSTIRPVHPVEALSHRLDVVVSLHVESSGAPPVSRANRNAIGPRKSVGQSVAPPLSAPQFRKRRKAGAGPAVSGRTPYPSRRNSSTAHPRTARAMATMAADPGGRPARSELSTTQSALRPADTGSIHTRTSAWPRRPKLLAGRAGGRVESLRRRGAATALRDRSICRRVRPWSQDAAGSPGA